MTILIQKLTKIYFVVSTSLQVVFLILTIFLAYFEGFYHGMPGPYESISFLDKIILSFIFISLAYMALKSTNMKVKTCLLILSILGFLQANHRVEVTTPIVCISSKQDLKRPNTKLEYDSVTIKVIILDSYFFFLNREYIVEYYKNLSENQLIEKFAENGFNIKSSYGGTVYPKDSIIEKTFALLEREDSDRNPIFRKYYYDDKNYITVFKGFFGFFEIRHSYDVYQFINEQKLL